MGLTSIRCFTGQSFVTAALASFQPFFFLFVEYVVAQLLQLKRRFSFLFFQHPNAIVTFIVKHVQKCFATMLTESHYLGIQQNGLGGRRFFFRGRHILPHVSPFESGHAFHRVWFCAQPIDQFQHPRGLDVVGRRHYIVSRARDGRTCQGMAVAPQYDVRDVR